MQQVDNQDQSFDAALRLGLRASARPQGIVHRLFLIAWPALRRIVRLRWPGHAHCGTSFKEKYISDWWRDQLERGIRRVIGSGGGGASAIGISVLSSSIPLLGICLSINSAAWRVLALFVSAALMCYAVLVVISYSAYVSLRAQPPEYYAKTMLAGRAESDAICIVAYEVLIVCRRFKAATKALAELHKSIFLPSGELENDSKTARVTKELVRPLADKINDNAERLSSLLARLKREIVEQEADLRRVQCLKVYLADQLGVSRRRICDHILQYSPTIHGVLTNKYFSNWNTVVQALKEHPHDPAFIDRLNSLVLQNERIQAKCDSRIDEQFELLANADLLGYVHRFASDRSSSGSAIAYAWSLSVVARQGEGFLGVESAKDARTLDARVLSERIGDRMRFLFRKQRAYPGLELHSICTSMLRLSREAPTKGKADRRNRKSCDELELDGLRSVASGEISNWLMQSSPTLRNRLAALANLGLSCERYISLCRSELVSRFAEKMEVLAAMSPAASTRRCVFVTQGYSKTVREAIRRGLSQLHQGAQPSVYVIRTSADDSDAQRMLFDLAEHRGEAEEQGLAYSVGSGHGDSLVGLLEPGDNVILVVGAECFDKSGRVLHPRVAGDAIESVRRSLMDHGIKCTLVVVAESYKRRTARFIDDSSYFRYHMDQLEVRSAGWADMIISDDEIYEPARTVRPPARAVDPQGTPPRRSKSASKKKSGRATPTQDAQTGKRPPFDSAAPLFRRTGRRNGGRSFAPPPASDSAATKPARVRGTKPGREIEGGAETSGA